MYLQIATHHLVVRAIIISRWVWRVQKRFAHLRYKVKDVLYYKMMSWPGFRHVSIAAHFVLDPIFHFFKEIGVSFYALLQYEAGFLSILIFVIAAFMGNFVGIEWYVIHLFEFFVGVALLANVFQAVINNIGELTLLSIFATCFILVFNILSINTYAPVMYEEENPAESCEEIIGCVLEMYTGGVSEAEMDQIYPGRFVFGLIYATIIGTIIGELTSSLMIDGYGSLK
jgi:hypothetical protein